MGFIDHLKSWFGKASAPATEERQFIKDPESGIFIETDSIQTDDPDHVAVIAMAIKTGKTIIATRGDDGKMAIKTLGP